MSGKEKKKTTTAKPKKPEAFNLPFGALKELKKKLADEEEQDKSGASPSKPRSPAPPPLPSAASAAALAERAEEDALTFHRMMSGVTPIDRTRSRVLVSQDAPTRSPAAELATKRANAKSAIEEQAAQVHEHLRALVEGAARFEITDDGRRVEGRRVDLPPDVLRKLRRGVLPIDARLDLHGLGAGPARSAVEKFLREKHARGERCVLVVHGKGEHSPRGVGVLRGEIAAWLSQSAASEHVAAFATATDGDGGEGAVYVLLRR